MLSEYRFTIPSVPTASLPLCSMIRDWIGALVRRYNSLACHSLTHRVRGLFEKSIFNNDKDQSGSGEPNLLNYKNSTVKIKANK